MRQTTPEESLRTKDDAINEAYAAHLRAERRANENFGSFSYGTGSYQLLVKS
jgi:hypothetical protein